MKAALKTLGLATALTLLSSASIAKSDIAEGKYQVDPMHSKIGFEIPHLVISSVEGAFKEFDGTIEIGKDFSKSKVTANAKIDSIDTGVVKRDEHLKSADFFEATKHPKMSFASKSIKGSPDSFTLNGDLTIKGTKKPVSFKGKYLGSVTDAYGNQKIAFTATTKINRKDFGLNWSSMVEAGPVVGDEVTIELKLQAAKEQPAKPQAKN